MRGATGFKGFTQGLPVALAILLTAIIIIAVMALLANKYISFL